MINLIFSFIIGAACWGLSLLVFDSFWTGIIPFIVASLAALIVFNRHTSKKIQPIMARVQEMTASVQTLPTMQARINILDKIVEELKKAYAYQNYQFGLKSQIDGQIGSIYYAQKKFDDAEPYLKNAFIMNWQPCALYACLLFKKKKVDEMKLQFEKIVKITRNQALLWNLYAWCLMESKEDKAAIEVLNRGKLNCPGDKILLDNLNSVKNNGKVNMKAYNELWYQFLLEDMPMPGQMPYGAHGRPMDPYQKELLDRYSRNHAR